MFSSLEEFLLTGADLCRSSSAVCVVLIRLRKFAAFWPKWAESAVLLEGLASQLKPSLPTLALGNVTNVPRSRGLRVWTLNGALTLLWHRFNQRSIEIELDLYVESFQPAAFLVL